MGRAATGCGGPEGRIDFGLDLPAIVEEVKYSHDVHKVSHLFGLCPYLSSST